MNQNLTLTLTLTNPLFTLPQCTLAYFPTSSSSSFLSHCSVFCYFHSHTQFTVSAVRDPQLSSTLVTPTRTRVDSLLDSASPSTLPMAVSSSTDQPVASLMDGSWSTSSVSGTLHPDLNSYYSFFLLLYLEFSYMWHCINHIGVECWCVLFYFIFVYTNFIGLKKKKNLKNWFSFLFFVFLNLKNILYIYIYIYNFICKKFKRYKFQILLGKFSQIFFFFEGDLFTINHWWCGPYRI